MSDIVTRITYSRYLELLRDPETDEDTIARYSTIRRGSGALDLRLVPDPSVVDMTEAEHSLENAMTIANDIARWRRRWRFDAALPSNTKPVLVAEGDSWFQFPVLIKETIDALGRQYLISCLSAAGDTALNIVYGPSAPRRSEYMSELRKLKGQVQGFLFSAAGNDIIGEDLQEGAEPVPVLQKILKQPSNGASRNPSDFVDMAELARRIAFLEEAYKHVIATIRREPGFETLPVFIHGYDVPFPYPWNGDRRNPLFVARDQWLGRAFNAVGLPEDPDLRRSILAFLIDALYSMLNKVAGDPDRTHVHVVDCRGVLNRLDLWADEIHGTTEGFRLIADRFHAVIDRALPGGSRLAAVGET